MCFPFPSARGSPCLAVPWTDADVQRSEQDLCHDQPCGRASGHPSTLVAAAVPGAALARVPGKKQEPKNPLSCLLCVSAQPWGAHSPPRLTEREQEVEEKNRRGRVRGCQLSPRLALPLRRRSQRQQSLRQAQPQPRCLLARRRKAKKVFQILFFPPHNVCSPRQCGFPGADLKAAVQNAHGHRRASHRHRSAPANLELCCVNPGSHHLKFMVFSFLSS